MPSERVRMRRFAMITRCIPKNTKAWLALVVALVLLPTVGTAKWVATPFDEQLIEAANSGHIDLVESALGKGADPNAYDKDGETALTTACTKGHIGIVNLLLNNGADPNAKGPDSIHAIALFSAARAGQREIVELLLSKDADVNDQEAESGETPLTAAAANGHLDVVKLLVATPGDPDRRQWMEQTALLAAADSGRLEVVKLLLAKGVDVNASDVYTYGGRVTPLMVAARKGQLAVVRELLAQGADANVTTSNGETALSIAQEKGHIAIEHLLREVGAK